MTLVKKVLALGIFASALSCASMVASAAEEPLPVGTKAPDFTRKTSTDQQVSLHDFAGKKTVVLYFYPKDETPGCTKEACTFRDEYQTFKDHGAEVIGVSGDTNESHQKFSSHYSLPFPLISDADNSLQELYHVPSIANILHGRVTFVIDKHGVIRMVFNNRGEAEQHVKQAAAILEKLNAEK